MMPEISPPTVITASRSQGEKAVDPAAGLKIWMSPAGAIG